jgi:hypothetical protein
MTLISFVFLAAVILALLPTLFGCIKCDKRYDVPPGEPKPSDPAYDY